MKRKIIIAVITFVSAVACAFGVAACTDEVHNGKVPNGGSVVQQPEEKPEDNPAQHVHSYDSFIIDKKYLKTAADCTHKAVYYKSCECGEKGEETFESGGFSHTFDQQVSDSKYLYREADCNYPAAYYYSCKCGEKGYTMFSYGEPRGHIYNQQVVNDLSLKSKANCTNKAVYYYSCDCGLIGKETFEYGEPIEGAHVFYEGECYYCHTPQIIPLEYELNSDGESYAVKGFDKTSGGRTVIIPAEYDGKPVTRIADYAFTSGRYIKSVTIPDSVTSIGGYAFLFCNSLENITLGKGLKTIGEVAFSHCESLKSLTLPDGLTTINSNAFTFCNALEKLTIPDSVTEIGMYAFNSCDKLQYNEYGNALYLGNSANPYHVLVKAKSKDIDSCLISEKTELIYYYAFYECPSIANITIPDGVSKIYAFAFNGCEEVERLNLGNGVKFIGDRAFTSVKSVNYNGDIAGWCNIEWLEHTISFYHDTKILFSGQELSGQLTLPAGVTSVPSSAFFNCTSVTGVTIPEGVTSIGDEAFMQCSELENISIPDSVKHIGENAFASCNKLNYTEYGNALYLGNAANPHHALVEAKTERITSSQINENTKVICRYAYSYCRELKEITIPAGVAWIGGGVFQGCESLESIEVDSGNTAYHSSGNCLIETGSKILIAGCKNSVIPADGSVTAISDNAFRVIRSLTEIAIPDCVTSIGKYAFGSCSSLESVVLPEGITELADGTFFGCSSLKSVVIPKSLTYFGMSAFGSCSSLTDITYNGTVEEWNRFYKGYVWNEGTGDYVVHCTDGDIKK